MFKRVEKRRRKQEEEEELGLDEDTKDVLGLNDTDSDESDSDSDDDSESEAEGAEDGGANEEGEAEDDDDEDSSEDGDDAEEPPISVEEALRDPVYVVSLEPDVKACIVCPGKLLKNSEVLTLHRASKAHERRWRQFSAFAKSSKAAPDSNAWDVLKQRAEQEPKLSLTPSTVSKRNEKREAQKAKIEARREKRKEAKMKVRAKKAASEGAGTEGSEPTKKKRKVEDAPAVSESTEPPAKLQKKGRSPRSDRLERQGKLVAKLAPHEPPGGRGKGNGKKKGPPGERGKKGEKGPGKWQDERGKRQKKDGKASDKSKPLQIFD
ncbi:hypothetical protein B0H19DRAFT_1384269 [Mycena capillaripes]|nr:hypothetical protein B0H19DRAFT_1384269 [Mycena capillaripes]